ncbi:ATP-binding protein [Pacificoceanicola onchidii]|uniref:ATP-binding protein n=1 Tax=Pacificoceanicola onchidii TaxID=2562685 RepID=UPI0010A5C70B|nr:ATP-binding protein [Pacificoceanicola onchidii]
MKQPTFIRGTTRATRITLAGIALAFLLAVAFLVSEVVREFRSLRSANSDNTHWTLSQAEVEFLEYRAALVAAGLPGADAAALDHAVIEFDLFYSRIITLSQGQLYDALRAEPDFGGSVAAILEKLDAVIPVIDGPRDALRTALPELVRDAEEIRPLLRLTATTGLGYFAKRSDVSRESVAETLLRLAALTIVMLLALLFAIARLRRISLQAARRGEELADAYARLNTILDTSLDAVIVSDMGGRIQSFNPAAEKIFGHRFSDVYGRKLGDVIIPDHLRAAHDAGMERMRTTQEAKVVGHGRVRLEGKRSNGEVFPVELALQQARAGDQDLVIGFLRDISHRVASENELMEARDKALAGEKAKSEFLAMMTHEIRTPLNGLLGNLALLKKTQLDSAQSHNVRSMDISGALLMHHVDAVLDVARFEAGASETTEEVVHLGRVLQDIVDSQAGAAEKRGNSIHWSWSGPALAWVAIDASRLEQILLNLVGNAIKFTGDGRILIELEQIGEGVEEDAAARLVEIRVIDTGIGISEDEQPRIFDDFHTGAHPASGTVDGPGGTGLGLGIARRFVQAMGGEMGVESTPGEGSVFWLRVPMRPTEAPAEADQGHTDADDVADQPPRDVLLVEDNEINRDLARHMLRDLGHRVTEARDGVEAVQAAGSQRFDLILMDIRMPRMDGLEATRHIRSGQGPNSAVPIVAVSANVLPEARDRFLAEGMSGFLPKPLEQDDLARVIARFTGDAPVEDAPAAPPPPAKPPHRTGSPTEVLTARYVAEVETFFEAAETGHLPLREMAEEAHRIAGSAAVFGQSVLRTALVEVEEAAEQGDPEALATAMGRARAAWRAAPAPTLD